ncbi:Ger(x)C family spore germination protein [Paenibacillus puldeungensis]|uniref:Ger(X)C family spore germination protein n=1 Tax=Paenibacillus puldeungensis TaxID=696536 RepID=A0ABW3S316_9BACL
MRRILLAIFAATICLLQIGCWNRTELNELGITAATGLDRVGDEWVVSYQIIVPTVTGTGQGGGGGGGQPNVFVFSTNGKSIREAGDLGYMENPRRLYFAHNEILVIGRTAAEQGIDQILDLYFRNIDARETVLVAITDETAADILRKMVPPEKIPGSALSDILRKESNFSSFFPVVRVYQLAQKIVSDSQAAGVPEIHVTDGNAKALESLDVNKTTSPPVKMKIDRLGVFHRDKLVGWLDRKQSYGISWLTNQVKGSTVPFTCPKTSNTDQKIKGSIRLSGAKTKVTPIKEGDHYTMKIQTQTRGDLLEYMCDQDPSKPETIIAIQKQISEAIIDAINSGWEASRKMHVDLPGFANKVHRKYPKDWKKIKDDWEKDLNSVKLDIQVKVKVQRPGLFKKSFDMLLNKKGSDGE